MKYHIHKYAVWGLAELDIDAENDEEALYKALATGTMFDYPDRRFVAFIVKEKEDEV